MVISVSQNDYLPMGRVKGFFVVCWFGFVWFFVVVSFVGVVSMMANYLFFKTLCPVVFVVVALLSN